MTYPDTLEIEVTQRHIDNGIAMDCTKCPIALAITEQYPSLGEVRVYQTFLRFDIHLPGDVFRTYSLPKSAQDFIQHYDHRDQVAYFICASKGDPFCFVAEHEE